MAGTMLQQVLTAQSALDTTHTAIAALAYDALRMFVKFGAGTSAGVVALEGATEPGYAGTWVSLGTASWVAADGMISATPVAQGHAWPYVRARISTAVVGGTVDVFIAGN